MLLRWLVPLSLLCALCPAQDVPACDSEVFCRGELLRAVQNAAVFQDSKQFVDRPLTSDPECFLAAFRNLSDRSPEALRALVLNWTQAAGSDLLPWQPTDWKQRPALIDRIQDSALREFALDINSKWLQFGRETSPSVHQHPERHSLVAVPHPFIVPGGRFREFYYWDTYWVLQGLMQSEMNSTAWGMIENLVFLVDKLGHVPNGGRTYYSRRSQPPLLTQMAASYSAASGQALSGEVLGALAVEHSFWRGSRNTSVRGHRLCHYAAPTTEPRPESYREDNITAMDVPPDKRADLFSDLASGAESGWDFSSRWLTASLPLSLSSIRTRRVVPVDLNAILCANEATLATLFNQSGNSSEAQRFSGLHQQSQAAFDDVFWNEAQGLWLDWDLDQGMHLEGFYASSLVPLLWRCGPVNITRHRMVYSRLSALGVLDYPGGIPTSLNVSSQQWDFPNAWAPLQWLPALGWADSPDPTLRAAAGAVAQTWVASTYDAWLRYNHTLFEKYNCTEAGLPGQGGEYTIQTGFGWTNGAILGFLSRFPNLTAPPLPTPTTSPLPTLTAPPLPTLTAPPLSTPSPSPTVLPALSGNSLGWVAAAVLLPLVMGLCVVVVVWGWWLYRTGRRQYWSRVHAEQATISGGGGGASPTVYSNRYVETDSIGSGGDKHLTEFDL